MGHCEAVGVTSKPPRGAPCRHAVTELQIQFRADDSARYRRVAVRTVERFLLVTVSRAPTSPTNEDIVATTQPANQDRAVVVGCGSARAERDAPHLDGRSSTRMFCVTGNTDVSNRTQTCGHFGNALQSTLAVEAFEIALDHKTAGAIDSVISPFFETCLFVSNRPTPPTGMTPSNAQSQAKRKGTDHHIAVA